MGVSQAEWGEGMLQADGQHVHKSRGREAHGVFEEPKARAATGSEAGAETAEAELRPGGGRASGPTLELCPEGSTGGSSSRRVPNVTAAFSSERPQPAASALQPQSPSTLGPGPRAPTPAPLTAAPASGPWRTLSSTPALTPPPPSSARRPARRTRGARGVAGKWSPRGGPSPPRPPGARAASRLRRGRLRAALRFRPSSAVPSGKCSPPAEARDGAGREGSGKWSPVGRSPWTAGGAGSVQSLGGVAPGS